MWAESPRIGSYRSRGPDRWKQIVRLVARSARGVLETPILTDGAPIILAFLGPDIHRLMDPRDHEALSWQHFGLSTLLNEYQPTTGDYGTVGYMAPEQELHGQISCATDI